MTNYVKLEVITPEELFYTGEIELVIAPTLDGEEGFMANHSGACKLLNNGMLWIQEKGKTRNDFRVAEIEGGFIDVKETILIYTDAAQWSDKKRRS